MISETTHWPSPAKLNLFLYIIGRRDNGYHELQTLFQFVDHGDTLTITADQSGEIRLTPNLPGVAGRQSDLASGYGTESEIRLFIRCPN